MLAGEAAPAEKEPRRSAQCSLRGKRRTEMKDGDDMFKQKHLLMFRLLHQVPKAKK